MEGTPAAAPVTAMGEEKQDLLVGPQKTHLTTAVSSATPKSSVDQRRRSSVGPGGEAEIYWRSPVTMVLVFLTGVGSALALHGYYSSLNGKKVGTTDQQQTALRIGTTLAFITQVCLVGSVQFAYIQTLWRALKRSIISIYAIDAGFAASSTLLSFLNLEMLSKLRLASCLAIIAWCIPISSLLRR